MEASFVQPTRTLLLKPSAILFATLISVSAADQAFAEDPAQDSDLMESTATAEIRDWSDHSEIKVKVDLIGGLAATAYSIGPFKADPIKVDGKEFEPEIKDPLLAARGLAVDFKRKKISETGLQLEVSIARDAKGFVKFELVGADGKPLEKVGSGSFSTGKKMTYLVTAKEAALKSATLKLLFRDGGKKIDLPFTVETVAMTK